MSTPVTFQVVGDVQVVAFAYDQREIRVEPGAPVAADDPRLVELLDRHPHLERANTAARAPKRAASRRSDSDPVADATPTSEEA